MREININQIIQAVKQLCLDANFILPEDVYQAFLDAEKKKYRP